MQLTTVIVALFATAAVASPSIRPSRQRPTVVKQTITCTGGNAFCCAPEGGFGTSVTCVGFQGSCIGILTCCNNNAVTSGGSNSAQVCAGVADDITIIFK